MKDERPSSSAAPLRENDIGLLAPDDDDERFRLPEVRIAGVKLTSLVLVVALIAGAFFGVRHFINLSTSEVMRASDEVHEKLSPR